MVLIAVYVETECPRCIPISTSRPSHSSLTQRVRELPPSPKYSLIHHGLFTVLSRFKGRRKVDDYFLKADIAKVLKELEFYGEIKQTATPDADTALEEFKEYRRGLVEEIKSVKYYSIARFLF